ncbi:MAG: cytochrome P450 [Microthrixaceae bacterium]
MTDSEPAHVFDPLAPTTEVPHDELGRLRRACPISQTPNGTWYLARHADVVAASRDVERIESAFLAPDDADIDTQFLPFISEPEHGRVRRVINAAIAAHRLSRIEPPLRALCERLVDQVVGVGQGDLGETYISPIPAAGIGYLLGLPDDEQPRFIEWAHGLFGGSVLGDAESARRSRQAMKEISAYLDHEIAARLESEDPPDDFITRLVGTEVAGIRLSPIASRTQLIFLLVAGTETTRNLLANSILRLASQPELFDRLRAERGDLVPFIEESLRVDPPLTYLLRQCTEDVRIDDTDLGAGTTVAFGLAAANRDEQVFDRPDEFDLRRPNVRSHLAFGDGPHICPGAALARLEARVAIEVLLERVQTMTLDPSFRYEKTPVPFTNGPVSLPVHVTPLDARRSTAPS